MCGENSCMTHHGRWGEQDSAHRAISNTSLLCRGPLGLWGRLLQPALHNRPLHHGPGGYNIYNVPQSKIIYPGPLLRRLGVCGVLQPVQPPLLQHDPVPRLAPPQQLGHHRVLGCRHVDTYIYIYISISIYYLYVYIYLYLYRLAPPKQLGYQHCVDIQKYLDPI